MKRGVFRKFAKFKGKHLCQSLFFNEVADLTPETLLKKRLWFFPVIFNTFSYRTPLVAASMAIQNMTESYRKIQSTILKHIVKQFFRL